MAHIVEAVLAGEGYAGVLRAGPAEGRTTTLQQLGEYACGKQSHIRSVLHAPGSAQHYALLNGLLTELNQWDSYRTDGEAPLPPVLARLSGDVPPDEHSKIGDAVWQALRYRARHGPLLLLVDDIHRADPDSAAILGNVAQRAAGTSIGLLASAPVGASLHPALERLPVIRLPCLQGPDLAPLLAGRADLISPAVSAELITLCHGHPLVLREMLTTLDDGQLRGQIPLPGQPRLGMQSLAVFTRHLRSLPKQTLHWLLVLALGNSDLTTCVRAARRLGLSLDELTPAEAEGIVRSANTNTVVWSSPLTRIAIAQTAPLADLTRTYRALADVTTPQSEPVDHARWLARSLPRSEIEPSVLHAALIAMVRGGKLLDAYELAVQAASQAQQAAQCQRWQVSAAQLCWLAGYGEHALRLLDGLSPVLPQGETRTSASVLRCVVRGLRYSWPAPNNSTPLMDLPDQPCGIGQQARALGTALRAGWETTPPRLLMDTVSRLGQAYRHMPAPLPATAQAIAKVVSGCSDLQPDEAKALHAVVWWVHEDDPLYPKTWPPPILPVFIGQEDEYARQLTALLDTTHARAARSTRALLLLKLATAQAALGHWPQAARNASDIMALADELGLRALHSDALSLSAWICAAQGDESGYRRQVADAYQQQGRRAAGCQPPLLQWARARLALSAGRPGEAYEYLCQLHAGTVTSPHHLVLRRLSTADFVEAAVQAGQHADAVRCTEEFAAWVAEGAAEWARLDLDRCRALLAGSDGEQWYLSALGRTQAVGRLAATARTELSFGEWLRRHKRHREAREHLRRAEHYFDRLTAPAWRNRARAELRAAGETTPHGEVADAGLTAQELQIARLAAEGRSNRQIAEALTLSPRTVGYHLYKVFPKLNITSRTQLSPALDAGRPSTAR
jgi:DNA-binding CsgD family transcriptional regulator